MRIIIAGLGSIGTDLADLLIREGSHQLVLIDEDHKLCQDAANNFDALVLEGDGTDPGVLRRAEADQADVLVATTDSDAYNTVIAMLGKQFGVPRIIVKLVGIGLRSACNELGVDAIVSPNISASNDMLSMIHGRGGMDFSFAMSRGARLGEFTVDEDQVSKLAEIELPKGTLIAAIIRQDKAMIPEGKTTLHEGDTIVVVAQDDKTLDKVKDILKNTQEEDAQG
jgi:trk system potassium uptake protein